MRRTTRPRALSLLLPGALLTLLMGVICLFPTPLAVSLEGKVYDSFLLSAARRSPSGQVVVVDLDERTLAQSGQWPWPRYRVARLLEKIRNAGASAIALDMVFAEPDRTSLGSLSGEIRRDLGVAVSVAGIPKEALDTDWSLAKTLAEGPFVLGYQFDFKTVSGESCVLHPLPAVIRSTGTSDADTDADVFNARGAICNLPVLAKAAGASGFFNVTPDTDGVLRRVPLLIRFQGRLYPSLALAAYLRVHGGDAVLVTGPEGVESMVLSGRKIPLDRRGNILVNYRGRRGVFPHISAASILDGTADPAALKGKIVVFGTTATGLHEIRTSPLEAAQPGPEIHATVIDNLLAGDSIAQPPWTRVLELVLIFVPGLLLTVFLTRSRPIWGLTAVIPSIACIWLASWWLLSDRQVFLSPLLPASTLAMVFTLLTSLRFYRADREVRERTRKLALTQDAIIQSLAGLAETRHHETGGHIQRTRHYMRALATRLKDHPRFRHYLDDATVDLLHRLAPLHDIGKVAVSDRTLLKPDRLSKEEYEEIKSHTTRGSDTVRQAKELMGEDSFLQIADEIARCHHERWDGTGYPHGLKGDEIPIPGRLMAVADSYDAVISQRLYKAAVPHEEAVRQMTALRGTYFDPDILDAFLEINEEFKAIARRFADT